MMQDKSGQVPDSNGDDPDASRTPSSVPVARTKPKKPSKEERMAEALRANLRRRKSAAKARKASDVDNA